MSTTLNLAPMSKKAQKASDRAAAADTLREYLKPGTVVTSVLRHVSQSGMQRSISLCVVRDGEIWDISYVAARALDYRIDDKNGGIKIGGAGMDMGFALVYNLSRVLYPQGFERPANARHRNGDTSPRESDGGYALSHRWL